jgi:hypothetical protein
MIYFMSYLCTTLSLLADEDFGKRLRNKTQEKVFLKSSQGKKVARVLFICFIVGKDGKTIEAVGEIRR